MTVYIIAATTKAHKVPSSFNAFWKEKEWMKIWV